MPRIREVKEWIRVPNWIRHCAQGFMPPENHAHPPVAMGLAVRGSGGWQWTDGARVGVAPPATQMIVKTLELRESVQELSGRALVIVAFGAGATKGMDGSWCQRLPPRRVVVPLE